MLAGGDRGSVSAGSTDSGYLERFIIFFMKIIQQVEEMQGCCSRFNRNN
jgi:hypothetical protein